MAGLFSRLPKIRLAYEDDTSAGRAQHKWFGDDSEQSRQLTVHIILWPTIFLTLIGLMMIFSASTIMEISRGINPYIAFAKPLIIALVGLSGLVIIAGFIPADLITRLGIVGLVGGLIFQSLVITPLGIEQNGNRNWILLFGQALQPSEFLKLGFAVYLGWVLWSGKCDVRSLSSVVTWIGLPSLIVAAAVMYGHDMGTLLIFVAMIFAVLLISGVRMKWIISLVFIGIFSMAVMIFMSASRIRRVKSFFTGHSVDPLGADLQPIRAKWGLGTGGLTGIGPGASRQKWNYLPEAHTDFIFAILGEEFGFIGTVCVIVLFGILTLGVVRLIIHARGIDARIYATAFAGWVISQALINIFVVIGLLPVIGVPLPLVSSGGSAMLATLLAIGVLLAYARREANSPPLNLRHLFTRSVAVVGSRSSTRRTKQTKNKPTRS